MAKRQIFPFAPYAYVDEVDHRHIKSLLTGSGTIRRCKKVLVLSQDRHRCSKHNELAQNPVSGCAARTAVDMIARHSMELHR